MRKDSQRLEALEALLAEKRKHEGYLAKLEERRAGTPEHVFARLRDEYLTKLMDAQVRASAEAEHLSDGLEEDAVAVREAEEKLAALHEEKVEGELRAAVGEFDPKDWQKKLTSLNASISLAERERDSRLMAYERARSLLAEARGDDPTVGASPPSAAPPKMRPTTAIAGGPNFDELAFLNSVVGRQSPTGTPSPILEGRSAPLPEPRSVRPPDTAGTPIPEPRSAPLPEPKSAPAPEPRSAPVPEPRSAPVREGVSAPSPSAPSPAPAPPPAPAPELPLVTSLPSPEPTPAAEPAAAATPEPAAAAPVPAEPAPSADEDDDDETPNPLGRPTPRTSKAIKTLKCAECGSMNYPTEWYCERCGGELAAL
jgi:hypothetical protein